MYEQEERWRMMYPFDYEISDKGRVRNARGMIVQPWGTRIRLRHHLENVELYIPRLLEEYFPESFDDDWRIIPNFRSYEMNRSGEVRNRRTGRQTKHYRGRGGRIYVQLTDAGAQYKVYLDDLRRDVFGRNLPRRS